MAPVRRRRWLSAVSVVVRARLGASPGGGPDARPSSGARTAPAPGSATSRPSRPTNRSSTSRFFEAEAYAAWAGARLPTEVEWEKACAWDPAAGVRRRFPWGASEPTEALANLGGDARRPAPVGAYPAGASAYGVEQMLGDVWEWTTSPLRPWPGFTPDGVRPLHRALLRRLTTGSCAAARGRCPPTFCGRASVTGTIRSGVRSSPACGWPGTSPDVPAYRLAGCAAIGGLAGAGPAAGPVGAVVCAASAEARADERRRLGCRVFRRRACPGGGAATSRCGATPRSRRWRRR